MIAGQATPAATKHYADWLWQKNPNISPNSWRVVEGLTVGKVGFGCYRIGHEAHHGPALRAGLMGGINLIETASNYLGGLSEQLIGETLSRLVESGDLTREEVVIVTKGGYLQGDALADAAAALPADTISLGDSARHTLNPALLAESFETSRHRLNVASLDGYLLHNPEYHLIHAVMAGGGVLTDEITDRFYAQITAVFALFESLVQQGQLQFYGVSSNTFAATDHSRLDLARLHQAAMDAAQQTYGRKKRPALRMIELPLNLLELGALKTANQTAKTFMDDETVPVLELASRMHLSVLVNRPLNAFPDGGQMYRLAGTTAAAPDVAAARTAVIEVEQALVKVLGGWPQLNDAAVFAFKTQAAEIEAYVTGSIAYDHLYMRYLMPVLSQMDRALEALKAERRGDKDALEILAASYTEKVAAYYQALRTLARVKDNDALHPLEMEVRGRLPEVWRDRPIQQIALNSMASIPGVSVVLSGLREADYVRDALALYEYGDFVDVVQVLGAAS